MVKRLNEAFADIDHKSLSEKKDQLRQELKRNKLSWHDYLLHISGVKEIELD